MTRFRSSAPLQPNGVASGLVVSASIRTPNYGSNAVKATKWLASPQNVYHKGSARPHCNGNAMLSIDDAHQTPATLGGLCLSTEYVSQHKPLRWQSGAGHRFSAALNSVRNNGAFCLECQKLTLEEFLQLADSISYTLLSKKYVNNYTKIRLLRDACHLWYVQPKHLKEERRCPDCRGGVR
jgi:hypothetical protein